MKRTTALLTALCAVGALAGCHTSDGDEDYTRFERVVKDPPVYLGDSRPIVKPPRDAGVDSSVAGDAGDAGGDGAITDGGASDGGDLGVDMAIVPDAAVDASTAECERASDCTLAVALEACDACPIVAPLSALSPEACLVQYDRFIGYSSHEPFSCIENCLGTIEFCPNQLPIADCVEGTCVDAR